MVQQLERQTIVTWNLHNLAATILNRITQLLKSCVHDNLKKMDNKTITMSIYLQHLLACSQQALLSQLDPTGYEAIIHSVNHYQRGQLLAMTTRLTVKLRSLKSLKSKLHLKWS